MREAIPFDDVNDRIATGNAATLGILPVAVISNALVVQAKVIIAANLVELTHMDGEELIATSHDALSGGPISRRAHVWH